MNKYEKNHKDNSKTIFRSFIEGKFENWKKKIEFFTK